MRNFLYSQLYYLIGTAFITVMGGFLSFLPDSDNNARRDLPIRPPAPTPTIATIATVPPIDDPIADPTATPEPAGASQHDRGSLIMLQTSSADADDWVTMEWLAGDGNWYEVDGWRGHIHNGQLIWWVAPEDLGDGQFRWVVYSDDSQSNLLKRSDAFYLPEQEKIVRTFPLDW